MLPWSQEAIRAAWRLFGWNPRIRGGDAPRVVVCETWWRSFFMNNIGYIFIVRRLGKQSNSILSRSDSISNLELNLKIHDPCGPNTHARTDLQVFLIFCFKSNLLSADNRLPFHLFSGLQAHSGDRKSEMGIHETSDDVWRDDKDVQFRLSSLNVSSHLYRKYICQQSRGKWSRLFRAAW